MGAVAATREPRQDRSRATRQRLLEAAVDCLAELGWARATVAVVAERAGVSRGAAQHHFPTREALFTAALEYMAAERIAEVRRCGAALPAGARHTEAVVEMLVGVYVGPLFRAAAQVWVQAAADEALRTLVVPLEARMARETHTIAVHLLGVDEGRPGVRETVQGLLDMARGLGLADLLTDDSRRRDRIVRRWAAILADTLA
ncbi:MAG TPA: helix-turn-helix domain-containing protein [Jatrophihabitantaceae bacterium]|jgi:AcrR family transcriptional regulator|nr:helix-turn-helix domain-containing protein [Jatrophihabitantaceae bacterium]